MGPSTEGHPFLAVLITGEENMGRLEHLEEVNKKIVNPGDLTEEDTLALLWDSPAYKILPNPDNQMYQVVASYPDAEILESGWLIGEEHLANKVAVLKVEVGEGAALLLGPRVQHRFQTHGTFKLLFNSLLG